MRAGLTFALLLGCHAVEPEFADSPALTSVWQATSSGNTDQLINVLVQNHEFAVHRALDGRGPLFWAYEFKNVDALALLKHLGADDEAEDLDGRRPSEFFPDDQSARQGGQSKRQSVLCIESSAMRSHTATTNYNSLSSRGSAYPQLCCCNNMRGLPQQLWPCHLPRIICSHLSQVFLDRSHLRIIPWISTLLTDFVDDAAAKEDELAALLKEKDEEFASFQQGALVSNRCSS